ncbi:gas vesicle protein [Nonomuraea candida]|uniref:gas vesicle protein GvpO n=1 Tax=Nonomuraea candida TaxID=359159 RepID=UPI000A0616EE|nr:gas vesicle protein [Nonomuraea candida]
MSVRGSGTEVPRVRRKFRTGEHPAREEDGRPSSTEGSPASPTQTAERPAADQPPAAERSPDRSADRPPERPAAGRELNAATAGGAGQRHIADLTTKPIEGITSVQPEENGWTVNVEVLEDRRIPSSGDILALYQVQLDKEGGLQSYRRIRRYKRSNAEYGEVL